MVDEEKDVSLLRRILNSIEGNDKGSSELSPYVINAIAIIVTLVWAGSFIADVTVSGYNPPSQIHVVMLGIVGSIFGFQIVHRGNGD